MKNIFTRISDIITANINALIDQSENPEVMICQIIREMEDNICYARKDVTDAITAEKRLEREMHIHRKETDKWFCRAEAALKAGNEEMARTALTRKTEHENVAEELTYSVCSTRKNSDRLKQQLKEMCRKLEEAKRKSISLKTRQRAAQARTRMSSTLEHFEKAHDVHCRFDQMASKVMDMEARAEAISEMNHHGDCSEHQFNMIELNITVEKELDAMKKRLFASESA